MKMVIGCKTKMISVNIGVSCVYGHVLLTVSVVFMIGNNYNDEDMAFAG